MPQRPPIPPELRSRYRRVNCNSVDELMTKIREMRREAAVRAVVGTQAQSEKEIKVSKPPTTTPSDDLLKQLGLDMSSTSSSDESEVLNIDASPLPSDTDHGTPAEPVKKKSTTAPILKHRAILHQQALQEPPGASVRERIDRYGRDHGHLVRMAKFLNSVTPNQRCSNCRQRNRHLPSCSRQ